MATFKPGMRVRIRKDATGYDPECAHLLGAETFIVGEGEYFDDWELALWLNGAPVCALESVLEPILPPASDTWADEKVRDLFKPQYIEPVRTKEPA